MEQQTIPSYMQLTNCGYCAKSMRRKNLKDHTGRCHKGLPVLCAEGEALQRLFEELKLQREKEKEKTAAERLASLNQKRLEKQRLKAVEKEQEIIRQRAAEAHRKEQEEARKKSKRELVRLEKQHSKPSSNRPGSSKSKSAGFSTKDDNSTAHSPRKHLLQPNCLSGVDTIGVAVGSAAKESLAEGSHTKTFTENAVQVQQKEDRISKLSSLRICQDSEVITRTSPNCSDGGTDAINSQTNNVLKPSDSSTARASREHSYSVEKQSTRGNVSTPTSEGEMRSRFKNARSLEEIVNFCPNFVYHDTEGSVRCMQCSSSTCSKPISYKLDPDDSKSLQLAKFRDTKKKMLDHLYKTSMHQKNARWPAIQPECEKNVESGTRVIRAIYGKIKAGRGYKCIEEAISEKAADDLDVGNINHGRNFAGSMTAPIYEAIKRRVQKSIKKVMPGFGQPPPFCLLADKMTPARTTLQIVGIISPSPETGKLQSICLGVKACHDGTGLGTTEEMVDCLRQYFSAEEIKESLVGVAVDGAYHHHNIKDHLPSVLQLSREQKEILATCWDAFHLIELSAQKSRGQNSKEKSISIPWIRDTFDIVTSVKTFAGRGKNWKELQDSKSLEASQLLHQGVLPENLNNKPLKKFQSFSNTRFARFSQRVLGNMRENFRSTCTYMESKSKEGSRLLGKLTRPEFALRLCGLDDIYDEIGRASERLQSCRIYGWNTVEILEETTHALKDMTDCLRNGQPHPKMTQFNLAAEEVLGKFTYQGVSLQGSSSENHAESALSNVREDLAQHVETFTQDLDRRAREQTPKICQLSREAFAMERVLTYTADFVPSEFDQIAELHSSAGVFKEKLTKEEWQREYLCFTNAVRTERSKLEGNVGAEEAIYSKFFTDPNLTGSFTNVSYLLCRSALQSSCEAVTEGMGSVVKNTLEGRENMAIEKLSQEVFIRMNGPKSNRKCNGILLEAGDLRFGDRSKWHFITNPKAKYNKSSKVLCRLNDEDEKYNFASDTDEEC